MISSVLLITVGCFLLIGLGQSATKDFPLPSVVLLFLVAAIVGLNFLPPFTVWNITYSWGTLLFFLSSLFFWFFRSSFRNALICFLYTLLLSALLYGATFLASYFGSSVFSSVNLYYGFIIGFFAFICTKNARYGFVSSVLSLFIVGMLTQSAPLSLNLPYEFCVVGGIFSCTVFAVVQTLLPKRPNKLSYYYEIGRMK